jgi:hypothetical protein
VGLGYIFGGDFNDFCDFVFDLDCDLCDFGDLGLGVVVIFMILVIWGGVWLWFL